MEFLRSIRLAFSSTDINAKVDCRLSLRSPIFSCNETMKDQTGNTFILEVESIEFQISELNRTNFERIPRSENLVPSYSWSQIVRICFAFQTNRIANFRIEQIPI